MSGRVVTAFVVTCDACGVEFGSQRQYPSAVEARAAAYIEGWRFPGRRKKNGQRGQGRINDYCGMCAPKEADL